jgi:L-fuculose-phosphate aldolase
VSSEWNVQRDIYKSRDDIHALVHTHSKFATTLAALQLDLPAANFMLCNSGAGVIKCTGYHSFYSQELADDIIDKMQGCKAVLMGNHGMLVSGVTLKEAYNLAVETEFSAEVYWRAKCIGNPYILTEQEVDRQVEELYRYTHVNDK